MDKKAFRDILLQKVEGGEFCFYVVTEPNEETSYDFYFDVTRDEVLAQVMEMFDNTDMFDGVSPIKSHLQERVDERVAQLSKEYSGKWLGVMYSGLDNYASAWKEIYEHLDEWDAETIEYSLQYFNDPSNFDRALFLWMDGVDTTQDLTDDNYDLEPLVEGEGVVRDISYYSGDHLIELSCHVWEDLLLVHISDFNIDGGDARKVEVKDIKKLMSVLGVESIEDVLDALTSRCESLGSPLDKDRFYQFLKENGLEYVEEVVGIYETKWGANDTPQTVYHPIGE